MASWDGGGQSTDSVLYSCPDCPKVFADAGKRDDHRADMTCRAPARSYGSFCELCETSFSRKDGLKRHNERFHSDTHVPMFECGFCREYFANADSLRQHRELHRQEAILKAVEANLGGEEDGEEFVPIESAHNNRCVRHRYIFPTHVNSIPEAIETVHPRVVDLIHRTQEEQPRIKVQLVLNVEYVKIQEDATISTQAVIPFRSNMVHVMPLADVDNLVSEAMLEISVTSESFYSRGSGWTINEVCFMDVEIAECHAITGGCALHTVEYKRGRGVRLEDATILDADKSLSPLMDCFYTAVASHFTAERSAYLGHNQVESEQAARVFANDNFTMNAGAPVNLSCVEKFEAANYAQHDLAINVVYMNECGKIYPVRASKNVLAKNKILLYLAFVETSGAVKHHYARVRNANALFSRRVRGNDGKIRTRETYFCFNCFNYQTRSSSHMRHVAWCHEKTGQMIRMPKKGDTLSFQPKTNYHFKSAYMLFFDFETLQVRPKYACACEKRLKKSETRGEEGEPPEKKKKGGTCPHKTKIVSEHHAFAYSYVLVDRHSNIVEENSYLGSDAAVHFLETLFKLEVKYLGPLKWGGVPMNELDAEQREQVMSAVNCHICHKPLENDRAMDHDHISGEFVGVAHKSCNLQRKEKIVITTFAHNFSGYDSHILMRALPQVKDRVRRINAIPLNTQKFKCLNINRFKMLDSASFLPDSLERLVNTLVTSQHDFPLLSKIWPKKADRDLLLRKGVYPYCFATSIKRLRQQKRVPPRADFFNDIGDVHVSEADYAHARSVWSHFGMTDMLDYTRLYVRTDTLLLAEAVVNLREAIQSEFEIELTQYLSLPMMAKDIMLKTTGAELDLISDQEMSHLIQSNIRGGLSYINTREYDTCARERRSLTYLDANNLYGQAMCFPMPLRDFEWMSKKEISKFDAARDVSEDDGVGYFLEVTLHYPEHLHLPHNSFPLAAEHVKITENDLSPYSRACLSTLHRPEKYVAEKLTTTFRDRKRYLVHGLNLQLYLRLGLQLVKIHRGIKFHQETYIKPYIHMCMNKRAAAKTKSEGDLMKLLSNSLYGKLIEGVANRMDCKFNYCGENLMRQVTDPLYKGFLLCGEDFSVTFHKKRDLHMKQSWAVGFSVLELSKFAMQRTYYETLAPRFNGRLSTLMTDTDSWVLATPTCAPDETVGRLADVMDCSNYEPSHPLHDMGRKNRVGYLKNEVPKDEIVKFIGIRSKTYAFKTRADVVDSRAKGVKRCYKRKITFEDYQRVLKEISEVRVVQNLIQSKNHQNMLVRSEKVAFSSFDDKRYLLCPIHSTPYGSVIIGVSKREGMCYFCKRPNLLV